MSRADNIRHQSEVERLGQTEGVGAETTVRRIIRDIVIGVVSGLVIDATTQYFRLDFLFPVLPYIWFLIFLVLTYDGLKRSKTVESWLVHVYGKLNKRQRVLSYFVVAIIGIGIAELYWLGVARIFSPRKPTGPFAFTESIPDVVTVVVDNGANIHMEVNLQSADIQKTKFTGLFVINGQRPLAVYIEDRTFFVDTHIGDGSGRDAIEVKRNNLTVKPAEWDRNFSANAVEVVDANQRPIFQMIRKRANLIQVAGLFAAKGAIFDARPIKALFKYPAWKFPGIYSDDVAAKFPSQGPYAPTTLVRLDTRGLISTTQALSEKLRAIGKEWDDGYFHNNAAAIQHMNAAATQEEKNRYTSQRVRDNDDLLDSLKQRFDREYLESSQSLRAELTRRTERPEEVLKPLDVPPLLRGDVAAGPNPFNDVADYLDRLASRLH